MAKASRCPLCYTKFKLHADGHTLVCPECGYKLCDHSDEDYDLFNNEHYHSDYVTASDTKTTYVTGKEEKVHARAYENRQSAREKEPVEKKQVRLYGPGGKKPKALKIIIVCYFLFIILSMILGLYE